MSDRIIDRTCVEFVEAISTKEPVPGGGGAAAVVGAIGIALGNMVGSLTVGKKKYADVQEEIISLKHRADILQSKLLEMAERDAAAFAPLAKAYGMPKETEEQRAEKARVMRVVLLDASAVPMEIMELCVESLNVIERFSQIGSSIAISDAGCAAACCQAALKAASLNVFINTKSMEDRKCAEELNEKAESLLQSGCEKADAVFSAVRRQL